MGDRAVHSTVALSSRIREEAARLGFLKIGIARAESLADSEHLTRWLLEGKHGSMLYLERQPSRRLDPRLVFSEARSVLVLAMNYYPGDCALTLPMHGRVSRYAWSEDYHTLILPRLEALVHFMKRLEPSADGRCYVDTGPVMEKVWGARAGIGWLGKNSNLITRNHGSWVFLGVILLNLELEYDPKAKDHCGTCRKCLDLCPTGAITAPHILDAQRCISYLTIELRGTIPIPLRPLIGNRIFGCDECQEVCPWNRFAVKTSEPAFLPRADSSIPDLAELVHLSRDEFAERFRHSPIYRATRDGFVRNVAVALGNSRSREAVPALQSALRDSSELVRIHAAWALETLQSNKFATDHTD